MIRNADIQGMEDGIQAPSSGFGPGPNLLVENSYLRNWRNINVPTPSSVNECWMTDKLVTIVNTRFEAPPGRLLSAINMVGKANGTECLGKLNEVRVYAYNGNAADNFQIYHPNSAVLPRPPGGCTTATAPGITGLISPTQSASAPTCAIAPIAIPGQFTSPFPGSTLTSAEQLFTWSAGIGVSGYQLTVGTSAGANDIYSGAVDGNLSALVTGLPTHGGVLWVRLSSLLDGAWQYVDASYTASGVPLFVDLAPANVVSVGGIGNDTADHATVRCVGRRSHPRVRRGVQAPNWPRADDDRHWWRPRLDARLAGQRRNPASPRSGRPRRRSISRESP